MTAVEMQLLQQVMKRKSAAAQKRVRQLAHEATQALAPLSRWAKRCHEASLELARHMGGRVARGMCPATMSQHSWLVLGNDCYDPDAVIIDPTLWSYDQSVDGVWVGTARNQLHYPHGRGSIWNYGKPTRPTGDIIVLTPTRPLSADAQDFYHLWNRWIVRAGQHWRIRRSVVGLPVKSWRRWTTQRRCRRSCRLIGWAC